MLILRPIRPNIHPTLRRLLQIKEHPAPQNAQERRAPDAGDEALDGRGGVDAVAEHGEDGDEDGSESEVSLETETRLLDFQYGKSKVRKGGRTA